MSCPEKNIHSCSRCVAACVPAPKIFFLDRAAEQRTRAKEGIKKKHGLDHTLHSAIIPLRLHLCNQPHGQMHKGHNNKTLTNTNKQPFLSVTLLVCPFRSLFSSSMQSRSLTPDLNGSKKQNKTKHRKRRSLPHRTQTWTWCSQTLTS